MPQDLLNVVKLCDALIKGQREFMDTRGEELHPHIRNWCEGRESAWKGIKEFCERELDNE